MNKYIIPILTFIIGFLFCGYVIIFTHAESFIIDFGSFTDWIVAIGTLFLAFFAYQAGIYTKKIWRNEQILNTYQTIENKLHKLDDNIHKITKIKLLILQPSSNYYDLTNIIKSKLDDNISLTSDLLKIQKFINLGLDEKEQIEKFISNINNINKVSNNINQLYENNTIISKIDILLFPSLKINFETYASNKNKILKIITSNIENL